MIKIAEWFGGIGATTQAFKNVFGEDNIHVLDYVELDRYAVASYNEMNGTNYKPTDINDIDTKNYPELDIIVAGWPCQDYSVAGKGLGLDGTRSNLILLTISKVKEMVNKPKHILLENVKGLLGKRHQKDLQYIKDLFDELGYNWNQALLNAKYFGVPQARERVFMLLTRKDLPMKTIDHLEERDTVEKVLRDVLDFSEPTETINIKTILEADYGKGVKKEYANYIYLPPTNPEKPLNNLEGRRLWKSDKYIGTIPAGHRPKVYFTNKMAQYTGKVIELDLDKMENQKREDINKIATLGELIDGDLNPVTSFSKRKKYGIDGQSNTLTTRSDHDNQIIFKAEQNGKPLNTRGMVQGIDGISRTLSTRPIDGSDGVKLAFEEHSFNQKKNFLGVDGVAKTLRAGDCDNENKVAFNTIPFVQDSKFQGVEGQSKTLLAQGADFKSKVVYNDAMVIHYRKLSTLECWRLMGFPDEAHNKLKNLVEFTKTLKEKRVISNSQLAKQAGNSIVVNVLEAIFKDTFELKEETIDDFF